MSTDEGGGIRFMLEEQIKFLFLPLQGKKNYSFTSLRGHHLVMLCLPVGKLMYSRGYKARDLAVVVQHTVYFGNILRRLGSAGKE